MVKSLVICGIILCSIIAIRASYQHYHCYTPWNRIEVTQSMWCERGVDQQIVQYLKEHPGANL